MSALPATHDWPLVTRVMLVDEPGFSRTALADALAATAGLDLVAVVAGRGIRGSLPRQRPDVLVVDDRVLARDLAFPGDTGARVIVIGVDDDPAYAARALGAGAAAWVPKDRLDLLLAEIFGAG